MLEEKGASLLGSSDDHIFIPITLAQRIFKEDSIRSIYLKAGSTEQVASIVQALETRLAVKFDGYSKNAKTVTTSSEASYQVVNQQEVLTAFTNISSLLTSGLSAIAVISLVVGGIGIMNIMLVSVSERTREIGIRKALGAKKRVILTQFLVESIVISVCGGVIGIIFGTGGMLLIGYLGNTSSYITIDTLIFAFVFSLSIGIIFGIAPANKAAKLRPIDALRFE